MSSSILSMVMNVTGNLKVFGLAFNYKLPWRFVSPSLSSTSYSSEDIPKGRANYSDVV